jgi:hypothetical protein
MPITVEPFQTFPIPQQYSIPAFDSIGSPIESRQCAVIITKLNRRFKQIRTTSPLTRMKWFDKDVADRIRSDERVVCTIPLPLGLRCLLEVSNGHAFMLSEKSTGRQIDVTGIGENSIFDGFVSKCAEGYVFVAIDSFVIAGEDIRKLAYHDRLAMTREVLSGVKSQNFSFLNVSIS